MAQQLNQSSGPLAGRNGIFIGYGLFHEVFPVQELVKFGQMAEQAGFDGVWTSDHFQPWMDNQGHAGFAWVTLAALGSKTSRLVMGTGVTCPTYRYNPAVVAEGFASLSLLNPGRIFLGVGSGEALNEQASGGGWGPYQERHDRLIEAVEVIRKLWGGQMVNHKGQYYQVKARLYDTPPQPVPIYISGVGPKSARLAGEYGDGWIVDSPEVALKPENHQAFEEGARSAGKDPKALPILTSQMAILGGKKEAEEVAKLWRFMPNSWTEYVDNPDPRDIERRAEKEIPLEKVYSKWTVSDDPQAHIQAIQQLIDKGITRLIITNSQPDQQKVINFYGREVLPKLRRQ